MVSEQQIPDVILVASFLSSLCSIVFSMMTYCSEAGVRKDSQGSKVTTPDGERVLTPIVVFCVAISFLFECREFH